MKAGGHVRQLADFAKKSGYEIATTSRVGSKKSFKQKLLDGLSAQISHASSLKTAADFDYDYKTEKKRWWWSAKAQSGKRAIKAYVDGRIVGDATEAVIVDDDPNAIVKVLQDLRTYYDQLDDSYWADEEARRTASKGTKKKGGQKV